MRRSLPSIFAASALATTALLATGCASLRVDLPPEEPAPVAVPAPPLRQAWKINIEAATGSDALSAAGRYLLVGTRKGTLAVVDADRGKIVGQEELGASLDAAPLRSGDVIWVPVERGRHGLVRYDALRGARASSHLGRESVRAPLLRTGDLVAAATMRGRVVAFDAATGAERWSQPLVGEGARGVAGRAASIRSAPTDVPAAEIGGEAGIVVVDADGRATRVDRATGAVRWRAATSPAMESLMLVGGVVVVPTTRGRLVGLDAASGRIAWTLALPDTTVRFGAPSEAGGDVVVGATDRQVRRVDASTGAIRWAHDAGSVVNAAPLVSLSDGLVYVGTHGRRLLALRLADGERVWEGPTGGRVKTAPVVAGSCIVVIAEPRQALCFRAETPSPVADANRP